MRTYHPCGAGSAEREVSRRRRLALASGEDQCSGWPTSAALKPISGVRSEKIEANQPGLVTIVGLKALHPAFISSQVPSWQNLIVSLVTTGSGSLVSFGTSLPSSLSTASLSARPPE